MEARQVFGSLPDGWEERLLIAYCPRCGASCANVEIGGLTRSRCTVCGYVHFVNPSPAVAVVVASGDRVLLCRRGPSTGHAGLWCLPSGHIEYNEDFITAGLREVEEETGLRCELGEELPPVRYLDRDARQKEVRFWRMRVVGESPWRPNKEIDDWRWIPRSASATLLTYEADRRLVDELRGDP
jgi:8-oxo-dGTP pyrophosphatase MutT (NUDIX family)